MSSVVSHKIIAVVFAALLLYGAAPAIATESTAPSVAPVALLLPLESKVLGKFADFVRQGVLAAAKSDPSGRVAINVYATTDDPNSAVAAYERALAQGNRLIIGPLARDEVATVIRRIQPGVPVLALNALEGAGPLPENVYVFSLQVEAEARQIARMVFADGRRSVLIVADGSLQAKRVQSAFAEELTRLGGRIAVQFAYSTAMADLAALRESANSGNVDAVLLLLDSARARLVRPYVDGPAQVYATSQVFSGPVERLRDVELNGVRFVDMPWLLQPDHPAVMVYARPDTPAPIASDSERLYAFGVDAYRIAVDPLLSSQELSSLSDQVPAAHYG